MVLSVVPRDEREIDHPWPVELKSKSVLRHIAMELAREPEHPLGDRDHTYHLYLPLTDEGLIDPEMWRRCRPSCRVRRLRPGQPETHGRILHGPGGHWFFDYGDDGTEAGFRLERERFVPGAYVSIREDDGKFHVFQVLSVKPA